MRVYIANSSPILYWRLARLISGIPGTEIVSASEDQEPVVDNISRSMADLTILAIDAVGGNGIEILQQIKQRHPLMRVMIFSDLPWEVLHRSYPQADFFVDQSDVEEIHDLVESLSWRYNHLMHPTLLSK